MNLKCIKCDEEMVPSENDVCHYCREDTIDQTIYIYSTTPSGSGPHSGHLEIYLNDLQAKAMLEACDESKRLAHGPLRELYRALKRCSYIT